MHVLLDDEICFTSMEAIFKVRSKLKGQFTDVISGCGTSVGPGSLTRSCNVATDRLVYQDVRLYVACPLQNLVQGVGFGASLSPRSDRERFAQDAHQK